MAGKKISRANMARIQSIADHAYAMGAKHPGMVEHVGKADMSLSDQMQAVAQAVYMANGSAEYCYVDEVFDTYVIIEAGDTHYKAEYSTGEDGSITLAARDAWVEVEEVWQPVSSAAAKAGLPLDVEQPPDIAATMKAAGDRQLEIQIAFGGPRAKDTHGEYFSKNTDLAEADFPTPPLIYYHGYDQRTNKAMSKPVVIGSPLKRWTSDRAHHILYQLKSNQWADQTWADACKGDVPASPGTVGYLIRKAADGELLYWPIAEVSAWDRSGGRKQAYRHTVATAALKALYVAEGISLPPALSSLEAGGDPASASVIDISPEIAGPAIAAEVARLLLTLRQGDNHP